jgi:hypothetical protein
MTGYCPWALVPDNASVNTPQSIKNTIATMLLFIKPRLDIQMAIE